MEARSSSHVNGLVAQDARTDLPIEISVDGAMIKAYEGEWLVDAITREKNLAHVCYHPRLGPIQTCDTCMVEVDGKMTRACSTSVHAGLKVVTGSAPVRQAQLEAMDVILGNHLLYCTVCDNNNQNCTVHNTTAPVPRLSVESKWSESGSSRVTACPAATALCR